MNANTFVIFADLEVDFEIGRSLVFIALICPDDDVRPGRFGKDLGDRNILESEFFGTATDRETRDIERMRMAFDQRSKFEKAVCHGGRSEEHTSELQSLMRISYAVFCLKKK